jgi:hypothetical protein
MLQPGDSIRPHVSRQAAISLVQRLYGLKDITVVELNGYDDKNYHVQVSKRGVRLLHSPRLRGRHSLPRVLGEVTASRSV